jgi:hypothetical protein
MQRVSGAKEVRDDAPTVGSDFDRGQPQTQRALVPLMLPPPTDAPPPRPVRLSPNAAFLTHLIATAEGVSQTRKHRRADPDWVIATYAAMVQVPELPLRPSHEYRR